MSASLKAALKEYWVLAVVIVVLIVLWQAVVVAFDIPFYILPTPIQVYKALTSTPGYWLSSTWVTLYETLVGFLAAVGGGVLFAFLISYSQRIGATLYPLLVITQVVPKVAVAPVFFLMLGFSDVPRILVVFLISFFPIVVDVSAGLMALDPDFVDILKVFKASNRQVFTKGRFPHALPYLFNSMKVSVTLALVGAIVAEFVQSNGGLGYVLMQTLSSLQTQIAYADILILGILGVALFLMISAMERVAVPWYVKSKRIHA